MDNLQIISWPAFKAANNIGSVQPLQGKGRRFIPLGSTTVVIPDKTNLKEPLFVILNGAHSEEGTVWLVNTAAQATGDVI